MIIIAREVLAVRLRAIAYYSTGIPDISLTVETKSLDTLNRQDIDLQENNRTWL
jgi:hypothetical protein